MKDPASRTTLPCKSIVAVVLVISFPEPERVVDPTIFNFERAGAPEAGPTSTLPDDRVNPPFKVSVELVVNRLIYSLPPFTEVSPATLIWVLSLADRSIVPDNTSNVPLISAVTPETEKSILAQGAVAGNV